MRTTANVAMNSGALAVGSGLDSDWIGSAMPGPFGGMDLGGHLLGACHAVRSQDLGERHDAQENASVRSAHHGKNRVMRLPHPRERLTERLIAVNVHDAVRRYALGLCPPQKRTEL